MNVVAITTTDAHAIQFHDHHHVGMSDSPPPTLAIDLNSIISYELRIERGSGCETNEGRAHLNIDTLGATRGLTFQLPGSLGMLRLTLARIDQAMS